MIELIHFGSRSEPPVILPSLQPFITGSQTPPKASRKAISGSKGIQSGPPFDAPLFGARGLPFGKECKNFDKVSEQSHIQNSLTSSNLATRCFVWLLRALERKVPDGKSASLAQYGNLSWKEHGAMPAVP